MRDDGGQPSHLDLIKDAVELLRNELVRKFNQQVRAVVDGEIHRRLDNLLNIVIGEVKITSQKELGSFSHCRLKFCNLLAIDVRIERVNIITMRCGHKMRSAVLGRDLAHGNSVLERLSAVIDFPQRVTMNINHRNALKFARPVQSGTPATGRRTHPPDLIYSPTRTMRSRRRKV